MAGLLSYIRAGFGYPDDPYTQSAGYLQELPPQGLLSPQQMAEGPKETPPGGARLGGLLSGLFGGDDLGALYGGALTPEQVAAANRRRLLGGLRAAFAGPSYSLDPGKIQGGFDSFIAGLTGGQDAVDAAALQALKGSEFGLKQKQYGLQEREVGAKEKEVGIKEREAQVIIDTVPKLLEYIQTGNIAGAQGLLAGLNTGTGTSTAPGPMVTPGTGEPGSLWGRIKYAEGGVIDGVPQTSRAGAVGLSQIMPETARQIATELKLPYDENRLRTDQGYNETLGRAYLDRLLQAYGGNEVLAAAAYNAGPGRVAEWTKTLGDPRTEAISNQEFAARIPFDETRTYLSRVFGGSIPSGANTGQPLPPPANRSAWITDPTLNNGLRNDPVGAQASAAFRSQLQGFLPPGAGSSTEPAQPPPGAGGDTVPPGRGVLPPVQMTPELTAQFDRMSPAAKDSFSLLPPEAQQGVLSTFPAARAQVAAPPGVGQSAPPAGILPPAGPAPPRLPSTPMPTGVVPAGPPALGGPGGPMGLDPATRQALALQALGGLIKMPGLGQIVTGSPAYRAAGAAAERQAIQPFIGPEAAARAQAERGVTEPSDKRIYEARTQQDIYKEQQLDPLKRAQDERKYQLDLRKEGWYEIPQADGTVKWGAIPGSPAAQKLAEAEEKKTNAQRQQTLGADIIIRDVDEIGRLAQTARLPTTGLGGTFMQYVPGSAARDIHYLLTGIKGRITLQQLTDLRNASPTGGGLGAVSDWEGQMLASALGSLEQAQSEEQFSRNLQRVKDIYSAIVHDPKNVPRAAGVNPPEGWAPGVATPGTAAPAAAPAAPGAPVDRGLRKPGETPDEYYRRTGGVR